MHKKPHIIILYHSGAGSTKTIAELYQEELSGDFSCDIEAVRPEYDYSNLEKYSFFVIAYPTYHCEPSASMLDFLKAMPRFSQPKPAFLFTTYGLYAANTNRIAGKLCRSKNIRVCGSSGYRAPATDGALLLPGISFMFRYGRKVPARMKQDLDSIRRILAVDNEQGASCAERLPRFKLYAVLNWPNQYLGKKFRPALYLDPECCVNCGLCIRECLRGCWQQDERGQTLPEYHEENCEHCFRCIHRCPEQAISLSKKRGPKKQLTGDFYRQWQEQLREELVKLEEQEKRQRAKTKRTKKS